MSENSRKSVVVRSMSGDIAAVILLVFVVIFNYVLVLDKMVIPLSQLAMTAVIVSIFAVALTIVIVLHSESPFRIMTLVLAVSFLTGELVMNYGYIWYQMFWAWLVLAFFFGKPWKAFM